MAGGLNALGSRLSEYFRMQIVALFPNCFVLFDRYAVRIGISIVADTAHLPRHFYVRLIRPNHKAVVSNLLGHDGLSELSDNRQLIAIVTIERLEVLWQGDRGKAMPVRRDGAVVNIHHVGRLDKRVGEILVGWVERIVDLE